MEISSQIIAQFSNNLSSEKLERWISQFQEEERTTISKLLENYLYFDSEKVMNLLKTLHNSLLSQVSISDKLVYCPIGFIAKSGSALAYFYRTQNQIDIDNFIDAENFTPENLHYIEKLLLSKGNIFVFFDDFIGSGNQASDFWTVYLCDFAERHPELKFYLLSIVGMEEGISNVAKLTKFEIISSIIIKDDELTFSKNSQIFPNSEEREYAKNLCIKYGKKLLPEYPLGFGKGELLLSFFYSTPNNTLPIFWSTDGNWFPLLPRADSYRGPQNNHFPRPTAVQKSRIFRQEQLNFDLNHNTTTKISEEFGSLKYVIKFANLGIAESIIPNIIDLLRDIKYNKHEKKHITTLISIGDINSSHKILVNPFSAIKDEVDNTIFKKIKSLSGLFEASNVVFNFNKDGKFNGIFNYSIQNPIINERFVPSCYATFCLFSRENPSTIFIYSDGNGNIQIFSNGERILWCKGQSWHSFTTSELIESLKEYRRGTEITESTLISLTDLAIELSGRNEGSTLIVGAAKEILNNSTISMGDYLHINPMKIEKKNIQILFSLAKFEGAMIFDESGVLQGATALISTKAEVESESEPTRGSRHNSAAKTSASFICLAIVISADDSRISYYKNGKKQFYIYG